LYVLGLFCMYWVSFDTCADSSFRNESSAGGRNQVLYWVSFDMNIGSLLTASEMNQVLEDFGYRTQDTYSQVSFVCIRSLLYVLGLF
jgi:hypothetical protein